MKLLLKKYIKTVCVCKILAMIGSANLLGKSDYSKIKNALSAVVDLNNITKSDFDTLIKTIENAPTGSPLKELKKKILKTGETIGKRKLKWKGKNKAEAKRLKASHSNKNAFVGENLASIYAGKNSENKDIKGLKEQIGRLKENISKSIEPGMSKEKMEILKKNLAILEQLNPGAKGDVLSGYVMKTVEEAIKTPMNENKAKTLENNLAILQQLSPDEANDIVSKSVEEAVKRSIKFDMTEGEIETLGGNLAILQQLSPNVESDILTKYENISAEINGRSSELQNLERAKDDGNIERNSQLISQLADIAPGAALDYLAKEPKMLLNLDTYSKLINIGQTENSILTAEQIAFSKKLGGATRGAFGLELAHRFEAFLENKDPNVLNGLIDTYNDNEFLRATGTRDFAVPIYALQTGKIDKEAFAAQLKEMLEPLNGRVQDMAKDFMIYGNTVAFLSNAMGKGESPDQHKELYQEAEAIFNKHNKPIPGESGTFNPLSKEIEAASKRVGGFDLENPDDVAKTRRIDNASSVVYANSDTVRASPVSKETFENQYEAYMNAPSTGIYQDLDTGEKRTEALTNKSALLAIHSTIGEMFLNVAYMHDDSSKRLKNYFEPKQSQTPPSGVAIGQS
jgi:hypothetical protein